MSEEKKIYKVTVDTGGSFSVFETFDDNIFQNLRSGHESMIFLTTTDGQQVAIPTRFMITHKEL